MRAIEVNTEESPAMGLDEALSFVGELAHRAAKGDESAELMLEISAAQQLADVEVLELQWQLLRIMGFSQPALRFIPFPGGADTHQP